MSIEKEPRPIDLRKIEEGEKHCEARNCKKKLFDEAGNILPGSSGERYCKECGILESMDAQRLGWKEKEAM
ncbi:MAG: hypothetical protein QGH82_06870 [Candidatus Woesearchaeota archaeon]|jgi:hypothetical protein|nr:hypothetical protein [Candidatus Woesearchaeota archaeon]